MNKDVNKLLERLEPEIDKKCAEIKEEKANKKKQVFYILLLVMFITLPSLLILFVSTHLMTPFNKWTQIMSI